ncbi:hypothetical protein Rpal_3157 [Rhodopseudomonas palustris TIE-1]|uniref:AbiTii domain-containing protein n=1 Tax=Rhodopseudomonas palustris TaxID=1076 RepID=UPI000164AAA1|nr:hypothetical protein [Rhodopseudomonas palustris]ACF01661.1 hypothetical protein Rpal_3157 [Rhodopseudomonas palustris TIE-1]
MKLLDEIASDAIDDTTSLSVLLRKCLLLAHHLKNDKLKAWADQELNGYSDADALPPYRKIRITATGSFAGPFGNVLNNQPLASSILNKDHRHWAESANLTQPIAAYDIGKDENGTPQGGRIQWPADLVTLYAESFIQGWHLIRASQQIPGTVFVSIIDTVRTRILQLAIELNEGLGEDDKSALSDLSPKKVDQSVINHIYGGNNVIATHAENFAQIGAINVSSGNIGELEKALAGLGLDDRAISTLRQAMDADAKHDGGKPTIGQRTLGWLTNAASYTSKEGLKVGFEIARKTATKWIMQYYGLDV